MHEQGLVTELRRMQLVLDHLPKLETEHLPREAKRAQRGGCVTFFVLGCYRLVALHFAT